MATQAKLKSEEKISLLLSFNQADEILDNIRNQVHQIYSNNSLLRADQAKLAFDTYLKQRMAKLPQSVKDQISEILSHRFSSKINPSTNAADEIGSNYSIPKDSITVFNEKDFLESPLDFAIRIHEIEHAIQRWSVGENPYALAHPKYFLAYEFSTEKGAMTAESIYILSLPKKVREGLLKALDSDPTVSKEYRRLYENFLLPSLSSSDSQTYVQKQWNLGRYSRFEYVKRQAVATGFVAAFGVPIIALAIDEIYKLLK